MRGRGVIRESRSLMGRSRLGIELNDEGEET